MFILPAVALPEMPQADIFIEEAMEVPAVEDGEVSVEEANAPPMSTPEGGDIDIADECESAEVDDAGEAVTGTDSLISADAVTGTDGLVSADAAIDAVGLVVSAYTEPELIAESEETEIAESVMADLEDIIECAEDEAPEPAEASQGLSVAMDGVGAAGYIYVYFVSPSVYNGVVVIRGEGVSNIKGCDIYNYNNIE